MKLLFVCVCVCDVLPFLAEMVRPLLLLHGLIGATSSLVSIFAPALFVQIWTPVHSLFSLPNLPAFGATDFYASLAYVFLFLYGANHVFEGDSCCFVHHRCVTFKAQASAWVCVPCLC